jgi:hypothetical protein
MSEEWKYFYKVILPINILVSLAIGILAVVLLEVLG